VGRHSPDYFDVCYQYGRPGKWSEPVGLGRADTNINDNTGESIALTSNGHGRVLISWVRPDKSLVARWITTEVAAGSTVVGTESAGEGDTEVQQHCSEQRPTQLDAGLHAAAEQSIPAGESVKSTFEPVEWYGTANGNWAQAKLVAAGAVPTGTVVLTERALYFTANNVANADKVGPKEVRLPLEDIDSVKQESFGRNHWVHVRRRDGVDQCFKVLAGNSIDGHAVQEAVAILQSAMGEPTKRR